MPPDPCHTNSMNNLNPSLMERRFTVYVPSDPWESIDCQTWAEAQRLLAIKADEFVYAEIRKDGVILDDLQILWQWRHCPPTTPNPIRGCHTKSINQTNQTYVGWDPRHAWRDLRREPLRRSDPLPRQRAQQGTRPHGDLPSGNPRSSLPDRGRIPWGPPWLSERYVTV